jgi:excisionase family DNA binding protein
MILDPRPELSGHIAIAMRKHRQWAAKQGIRLPAEFPDIERLFTSKATRGQAGTPLDDLWEFRESRVMEPKLMTYDEAAGVLACSTRTVKRLIASGHLNPVKLGGGVSRLRVVDVNALTATPSDEQEIA